MASGIYKITCTCNGKYYIGSAVDLDGRWKDHLNDLRKGKHTPHFQSAWNKYGESNFKFTVLEVCSVKLLRLREQFYLCILQPWNPEIGFNVLKFVTSSLGLRHRQAAKDKVSAANKGRKHTPEEIDKIIKAQTGRKYSPETCAKVSRAKIGNQYTRGRKQSEETKRKISAHRKGNNRNGRPTSQQTKELIRLRISEWWKVKRQLTTLLT